MRFLIYRTPFLRKIVILVFNENFLNLIVKHSVLYLKLEVLDMFALLNMYINCKFRSIIKYCSPALEHLFSLCWCHKVFILMFFYQNHFLQNRPTFFLLYCKCAYKRMPHAQTIFNAIFLECNAIEKPFQCLGIFIFDLGVQILDDFCQKI